MPPGSIGTLRFTRPLAVARRRTTSGAGPSTVRLPLVFGVGITQRSRAPGYRSGPGGPAPRDWGHYGSDGPGVVTLSRVWVLGGVSGRAGAGFRLRAQAVAGRPAVPVICSQIAKRTVISARWSGAVIRWRWGRK